MSVPIPLGVRLINAWGSPFDVWVTRLCNDIQFRSVIPGGFANASITIHNDHTASWDLITQPLTRVQIVDLRSQEIAWEGHIDSRRRSSAADTWELGCLGSMACASDITRPMFYIDSDTSNFSVDDGATAPTVNPSSNAATKSLTMAPNAGSYTAQRFTQQHVWDRARGCNLYIGRVDATFTGSASSASFRTGLDIGANNDLLRAWNAASSRLTARVGSGITGTVAEVVTVAWDISGTASIVAGNFGKLELPRIQVQRVDETGAKLQTSGSYPQEYLTVEQIVRDVVGRFMVGAWHTGANNTPYHGMVGSEGIYIDTSSTAEITHLTYYDGVTAAKILTDLMEAQPEAYWAIWESRFGATTDGNADARHRFEWATWPLGYGLSATSIDGLEEQPDGGELANFVWFQHALATDPELHNVQTAWDSGQENPLLTDAQRVRGVTFQAEDPMNAIPAFARALEIHASLQRTTNTGTLTIKRPIQAYDPGLNSNSGVARMLDPWLIRPGKLIRITDIPPRAQAYTFAAGGEIAADTFGRTAASGWGTADTGQAWATTGGSAADFSVSSGLGRHSVGTEDISRWSTIPAPGADVDITLTLATDVLAAGGSQFGYVICRFVDVSNSYMARVEFTTTATVALVIRSRLAGVEATLAGGTVASLTHAANRRFSVRFKASGSSLMAKIWQASAAEPTAWNFTATDTNLTEPGSVGVRSVVAGANTQPLPITMTFDDFTAVSQHTCAPELDGTVFRVVGTTYNSSDNSCTLELDKPPAWDTATQVLESGSGSSNLVVRG